VVQERFERGRRRPSTPRRVVREYAINTAWLTVVGLAADLTAWLRLLALPEATEGLRAQSAAVPVPARPRPPDHRCPAATPATAASWPWVTDAVTTFANVMAIPLRT
jgi:hypothetical protein